MYHSSRKLWVLAMRLHHHLLQLLSFGAYLNAFYSVVRFHKVRVSFIKA